jgi:uncharacterized protein
VTRLGLISDTHGLLRPQVLELFAGVERILHAGDVGDPDILVELAAVAPVTAVWGNVDGFDVRARVTETAELEVAGRRIVVVHGDRFGSPTPRALLDAYPAADVVVFGHTHRPEVAPIGSRLAVNPGSAGPARFKLKPSIAFLELDGEPRVRLLEL